MIGASFSTNFPGGCYVRRAATDRYAVANFNWLAVLEEGPYNSLDAIIALSAWVSVV